MAKRAAGKQIVKDHPSSDEEESIDKPHTASAEVMAKRKIIKPKAKFKHTNNTPFASANGSAQNTFPNGPLSTDKENKIRALNDMFIKKVNAANVPGTVANFTELARKYISYYDSIEKGNISKPTAAPSNPPVAKPFSFTANPIQNTDKTSEKPNAFAFLKQTKPNPPAAPKEAPKEVPKNDPIDVDSSSSESDEEIKIQGPKFTLDKKPTIKNAPFSFGPKAAKKKDDSDSDSESEVELKGPTFTFNKPIKDSVFKVDKPTEGDKPAFSFGSTATATVTKENEPAQDTKPVFSFGKTQETKDSEPKSLFGKSTAQSGAEKPPLLFAKQDKPSLFSDSKATPEDSAKPFTFGADSKNSFGKSQEPKETPKLFGKPDTTEAPKLFGNSDTTEAPKLFGKSDTTETPKLFGNSDGAKAPLFSFGKQAEAKEAPKFAFGKPDEPIGTPKFSFGKTEEVKDAKFSFGKPEEVKDAKFSFGKSEANDTPKFSFGKTEANDTPKFSFGKSEGKDTPKFAFGKSEAKDTPKFAFGKSTEASNPFTSNDSKETPKFSFGKKEDSNPFSSGNAETKEAPKFSFGKVGESANDSNAIKPFAFGSTPSSFGNKSGSPAFSFSQNKEKPEAVSGGDDVVPEEESTAQFKPVVQMSQKVESVGTGEEGEEVKYTKRAKLMLYNSESQEYTNKGLGEMKVLYNPETKKTRVLIRADGGMRTIFNSLVNKNMTYSTMGNGSMVKMPVINTDKNLETYVLKVKTSEDGTALLSALKEGQKD